MKPISIAIEGIKSFYNRVDINLDFNGLFCICGDTGSGKSTVLDCIILALYGTVKEGNKLSDYINLRKDKGSVEFVFEATVDNTLQRYQVNRTIYFSKQTKARLVNLTTGEVIAEQTNQVNDFLQSVTGLSVGDFTQVVILEQGKFAKFLTSGKSDRSVTVSNLFKLDKYRRLGSKAHTAMTAAKTELEINTKLFEEVKDVTNEKIKDCEKSIKEKVSLISETGKEIESLNKKAEELAKVKEKYEQALNAKYESARLTQKLGEQKKVLAEKNENLGKLQKTLQRISESQTQNNLVLGKLEGLKGYMAEAKAYENKVNEYRQRYKDEQIELKKAQERESKVKAELQETETEYAKVASSLPNVDFYEYKERASSAKAAYVSAKSEYDRCIKELNEAQSKLNEQSLLSKSLLTARVQATAERKQAEIALNKAKASQRESYISEAAEAIKSNLREGDVCPVCGCKVGKLHLRHAVSVTIDKEEEIFKQKQTRENEAARAAANSDILQNEFQKKVNETSKRLEVAKNVLEAVLKDFADAASADEIVKTAEKAITLAQKRQSLTSTVSINEQLCETVRKKLDDTLEQGKKAAEEKKRITETVEKEAGGDAEKRLKSAQDSAAELAERKQETEQDIAELNAEISSLSAEIAATEAKIQSLKDTEVPSFDVEQVKLTSQTLTDKTNLKEQLIADKATEEAMLKDLRDKHERKTLLSQKQVSLKQTYDIYAELYKMVNGEQFAQYVAEEYILGFTRQASKILSFVTGGKYELVYEDGEYYVTDFMSGGTRKASTLSGGETFLASLALAVAISGEIARYKTYEFFFLDEGFGTLDERSLDMVTSALTMLGDEMMVGIVTHRSELTDRIFAKLEVSFSEEGSTVKRID